MFTNTPEVISYNELYQKLNKQNITQTKKTKFNWLINRSQYSLYELWANWLMIIIPFIMVLLLAIWLPIQEANLNLLKTEWLSRFNLIKNEIITNKVSIIASINQIITNAGSIHPPTLGEEIYNVLLVKMNSISIFENIPPILSFEFLIEDKWFQTDTDGKITSKIVEAFLMNDAYKILQSKLLIFHTALDFLNFNFSMESIFKFYPATAVIVLFAMVLTVSLSLKLGQRKKRLKKPWKYKTFSEDLQVFKRKSKKKGF